MKLKNKTVLVTGAARRVGKEIACLFAEQGANVIISYRNSSKDAKETVKLLMKHTKSSKAIKADISKSTDIKQLINQIKKEFGNIDVLINSASNFIKTPYKNLTEKEWDLAIDTNLKGPFLCALHASKIMKTGSVIINIADWSGIRPYRDYLPYCVSKSGLIGLTKALAKELAPRIRVNAIAPGPVLAPETMSKKERNELAKRVPLRRWGKPRDIAQTAMFLVVGTDFMTGAVVVVDGGRLIA